jgi:hypothetical protein
LAAAKTAKCSVVVAKLDRLSRDVAFVAGLMAQPVDGDKPGLQEHEANRQTYALGMPV